MMLTRKKQQKKTLAEADASLEKINAILYARKDDRTMLLPGSYAGLKSALVNPGFNHFAMNTAKFHADDTCTACGLCEKNCPVHSIKVDKKPVWGKECTMCLACINRCPVRAIQYGSNTAAKGRYYHAQINELEKHVQD